MTAFKTESWLWYGVVMVMISLRFASRVLHFKSVTRLQVEDWLMLFLTCAYTNFIVLINICARTRTNLIDPHDHSVMSAEEIAERTYGSKIVLGLEQSMCCVQWGAKACLLVLYYRLTQNLVQNLMVKAVGVYVAVTYVVMEILYFAVWCRPFSDYWQTPTDNLQCSATINHLITNFTFNLTSDVLIMSIPLPLLIRAHLDLRKKLFLVLPFSLGFFSMICAILSKNLSFNHPYSPEWVFWYTREASCVMIVANMPYTWGLARRLFNLHAFWSKGSGISWTDSQDPGEIPEGFLGHMHGGIQDLANENIPGSRRASQAMRRISNFDEHQGGSRWLNKMLLKGSPQIESVVTTSEVVADEDKRSRSMSEAEKENWNNINWSKSDTAVDTQRVSSISSTSPTINLTPPPPAAVSPSVTRVNTVESRRPSTAEVRRLSMADMRRASTISSRRSHRASLPDTRWNHRPSVHVDAIDRLYRLDDEDLITDLEKGNRHMSTDGTG